MPLTDPGFQVEIHRKTSGAYFRKVQSAARAEYHGIRGAALLPHLSFDPDRFYLSPAGLDHFQTGPLDRPSVYLGGHAAGKEMDVGLTWNRVYDAEGRTTYTDQPDRTDGRDPGRRFVRSRAEGTAVLLDGTSGVVAHGQDEVDQAMERLHPNFAFRPFWRTTNEGGNQWHQPRRGTPENVSFYPGETVTMGVQVVGPNHVRMEIRWEGGLEPIHFTQTFRQDGFGLGQPQSFKRVNSIDQFWVDAEGKRKGREGVDVLPTRTVATEGGWEEVYLLGADPEKRTPVIGPDYREIRGGDLAPRYDAIFHRTGWNEAGRELIDITPTA